MNTDAMNPEETPPKSEWEVAREREATWLASLKVGAEVSFQQRYTALPGLARISGETPKFWVVGNAKYRKDNGRSLGGGMWDRSEISEPTDKIREQLERHALVLYLKGRDWGKCSVGTLREVKALLADTPS